MESQEQHKRDMVGRLHRTGGCVSDALCRGVKWTCVARMELQSLRCASPKKKKVGLTNLQNLTFTFRTLHASHALRRRLCFWLTYALPGGSCWPPFSPPAPPKIPLPLPLGVARPPEGSKACCPAAEEMGRMPKASAASGPRPSETSCFPSGETDETAP